LWSQGSDLTLVIVGRPGWDMARFIARIETHAERGKRLFWFSTASDEYLDKLYTASSCLIAASYGEGFGLPIIEAARHGLPIIARDIPVFREIAQGFAYYFSAEQPEQLAVALLEWTKLIGTEALPQSGALPWLTWHESANMLLAQLNSMDRVESGSTDLWAPRSVSAGAIGRLAGS
jgi:glycosyltransferase involved in cell wall biosynthesis